MKRYRHLLYGFAKAAAIMEEGAKDKQPAKRRVRERGHDTVARSKQQVTPSGIVLPTGVANPPR